MGLKRRALENVADLELPSKKLFTKMDIATNKNITASVRSFYSSKQRTSKDCFIQDTHCSAYKDYSDIQVDQQMLSCNIKTGSHTHEENIDTLEKNCSGLSFDEKQQLLQIDNGNASNAGRSSTFNTSICASPSDDLYFNSPCRSVESVVSTIPDSPLSSDNTCSSDCKIENDNIVELEESILDSQECRKRDKTLFSYFNRTKKDKNSVMKEKDKRIKIEKANDTFPSSQQMVLQENLLLKEPPLDDIRDSMFTLPISPVILKKIGRRKSKYCHSNNNTIISKQPKKEQMYLDIGQKEFGHVTCTICGMMYTKSQEEDEAHHAKHHDKVSQKLKFKGWKNERLIEEFHDGRIIAILGDDCATHIKKLTLVKEVVDEELGFNDTINKSKNNEQKGFLFISSKKVIGCVIAVPIQKAYPILNTPAANDDELNGDLSCSWCCSTEPRSAICGISRIWVFSQNRRQSIATRLIEAIRHHFIYGCIIEKRKLAFSDPTPNGKAFAKNYMGQENVLVFR